VSKNTVRTKREEKQRLLEANLVVPDSMMLEPTTDFTQHGDLNSMSTQDLKQLLLKYRHALQDLTNQRVCTPEVKLEKEHTLSLFEIVKHMDNFAFDFNTNWAKCVDLLQQFFAVVSLHPCHQKVEWQALRIMCGVVWSYHQFLNNNFYRTLAASSLSVAARRVFRERSPATHYKFEQVITSQFDATPTFRIAIEEWLEKQNKYLTIDLEADPWSLMEEEMIEEEKFEDIFWDVVQNWDVAKQNSDFILEKINSSLQHKEQDKEQEIEQDKEQDKEQEIENLRQKKEQEKEQKKQHLQALEQQQRLLALEQQQEQQQQLLALEQQEQQSDALEQQVQQEKEQQEQWEKQYAQVLEQQEQQPQKHHQAELKQKEKQTVETPKMLQHYELYKVDVETFLKEMGAGDYVDNFVNKGWERVEDIMTLMTKKILKKLVPPTTPSFWQILKHLQTEQEVMNLKRGQEIGRGFSGTVYSAKLGGERVALKKFHQNTAMIKDLQLMSKLQTHPHVIQLKGLLVQQKLLIMEFLENGDLRSFLNSNPNQQSSTIFQWGVQIAKGMEYLHNNGILHRNLALRNILLSKKLVAKIGDFGMSKSPADPSEMFASVNFPLYWLPPECWRGAELSKEADVWSFGVTLWEMITLQKPYRGKTIDDLIHSLKHQHQVDDLFHFNFPFFTIAKTCLDLDIDKRPTFEQLVGTLEDMFEGLEEEIKGKEIECGHERNWEKRNYIASSKFAFERYELWGNP